MKINKYYFLLFFASLITYSQTFEEVSEIVYNKCTSCHRPGESGPINFTNYEDYRSAVGEVRGLTFIEQYIVELRSKRGDYDDK